MPTASAGRQSPIVGTERKYSVVRQSATKTAKKVLPDFPVVDDKAIDFETIESLFFAYRDFVSDPDAILAKLGYGRAHHRVVHFVSRRPGMTVADLLGILQITKQSLARVLKELIDSGYIRQMAGPADRRQRRLYPTLAGRELSLALSEPQSRRIAQAMQGMSIEERDAVRRFLQGMQKQTVDVPVETEGAE
jgi:DNA-binding MarR family transcriptional regulator